MSTKLKTRPLSASRPQRQQRKRHSSLNTDSTAISPHARISGNACILSCVDLRTISQKIEDLKNDMIESKDESNFEQHLHHLVLMQVYISLEYGDISLENARAYLNLSKLYFTRKKHFLSQAKFHALNARGILECLNIKPNDQNLKDNRLAYEIYLLLIQCSLNAKEREKKTKNKHILYIDKTHIDHDLQLTEKYLEKLKQLMNTNDYDKINSQYLLIKFDAIVINLKEFNKSIYQLIDQIVSYIEKYYIHDQIKRKIDLYLRCGSYLINYNDSIPDSLMYYRKAVELADEQEQIQPSNEHKHQLANAILQRNIAKVRTDRLTDDLEKEFEHAIQLYQQPYDQINKNILKVIDELATFYIKLEKYQDALNVLCESLPDKIRLFGDFSEEVIQTESRIGAIYLLEGESLNAVEHLKACLDLQEFVYGPNDSRTCEIRNSVELLKKDPMVSRIQNRLAFRMSNKISHEKDDLQFLQKKPSISSKT